MDKTVHRLGDVASRLSPVLLGLKKYESNFNDNAKRTLQDGIHATEIITIEVASSSARDLSLSGYILSGLAFETLKSAHAQLQQSLSAILSAGVPLPRSAKDDLSNLLTEVAGLKLDSSTTPQLQAVNQLKILFGKTTDALSDIDVVEAQLDDAVRQLITEVYPGTTLLQEQASISEFQSKGRASDAGTLSLMANSLQRLHASQLEDEDEDEDQAAVQEEEEEEEDEDDPFYMPMAPAAIKWADASKFTTLARPLGKMESPGGPFMIEMEPASLSQGDSAADSNVPGLTERDFEPVQDTEPPGPPTLPAQGAVSNGVEVPEAAPVSVIVGALTALSVQESATETASTTEVQGGLALSPIQHSPTAAAVSETAAAPSSGEEPSALITSPRQQPDEKLNKFVDFLSGDNPGACMFQAQMRLSLEGCRKLANFVGSNSRVKALSLSHNRIGDNGLKILCEGLSVNRSVTALDLPDNNIGDQGIIDLSVAIAKNTSLTQLQLAYNNIGDEGAKALAELIRNSQSLKKLGLSNNKIGKPGCQALTAALSENQSLNHLQLLPGNPVQEKDAKALAKALKRNKKFSIRAFLRMDSD